MDAVSSIKMELLKYVFWDLGIGASTRDGRVKIIMPNNNAPRDSHCDFVYRLIPWHKFPRIYCIDTERVSGRWTVIYVSSTKKYGFWLSRQLEIKQSFAIRAARGARLRSLLKLSAVLALLENSACFHIAN